MFGSFFFNVENFFFISLAIIFVLVLLLVYLFKQRIATVEKTGNTMFDMVRKLTDEVKWIKCLGANEKCSESGISQCNIGEPISKSTPEVPAHIYSNQGATSNATSNREIIEYEIIDPIEKTNQSTTKKIVVKDLGDSESESESECDSKSESESDYDTDSDYDSDIDSNRENIQILDSLLEKDAIEVVDLVEEPLLKPSVPIQVLEEILTDIQDTIQEPIQESVQESVQEFEPVIEQSIQEPIEQSIQEPIEQSIQEPIEQSIQEPIIEQTSEEPLVESTSEPTNASFSLEELKKMEIKQLRQLASDKTGQDVSKIKKNELIRLLTTNSLSLIE